MVTFDVGMQVELVAVGAEVHLGGRLVRFPGVPEESHGLHTDVNSSKTTTATCSSVFSLECLCVCIYI